MDKEVVLAARRQAALLNSLGLPQAAAEIEAFCRAESQPASAEDSTAFAAL